MSSCDDWLSGIPKILLQLDSANQYDHFEVQYGYVSMNIKEVMRIQRFLCFAQTWIATIHFDCLTKLTLVHEGFVQI